MTSPLSDDAARQVEAAVLSRAGWLTLGQLHAALRRAVIKADPDGAERRRRQAERNATVALYPEDEGTATLAGYSLPGVEAAAAMARITALAKMMKAAGSDGQIDWLRAHVFLGLLLGTLPMTPPADAPPDAQPPDAQPPDARPPSAGPPGAGSPDEPPPDSSPGRPDQQRDSDGSWPGIRPYLPSWLPAVPGLQPGPAGLLSLAVPLGTFTGGSSAPGQLSRLGVVTASQARQLAVLAARYSGDSLACRRDELGGSGDRGRPRPALTQPRSTARSGKYAESRAGQSGHWAHRARDARRPSRRDCSWAAGTGIGLRRALDAPTRCSR